MNREQNNKLRVLARKAGFITAKGNPDVKRYKEQVLLGHIQQVDSVDTKVIVKSEGIVFVGVEPSKPNEVNVHKTINNDIKFIIGIDDSISTRNIESSINNGVNTLIQYCVKNGFMYSIILMNRPDNNIHNKTTSFTYNHRGAGSTPLNRLVQSCIKNIHNKTVIVLFTDGEINGEEYQTPNTKQLVSSLSNTLIIYLGVDKQYANHIGIKPGNQLIVKEMNNKNTSDSFYKLLNEFTNKKEEIEKVDLSSYELFV